MNLKKLLVAALFVIYSFPMMRSMGILLGLHVSILSLSFFVLCIPLLSFLYTFFSFGSLGRRELGFGPVLLWVMLLIINLSTFAFWPDLFKHSFPSMFIFRLLMSGFSGTIPMIISGISVCYHWLGVRIVRPGMLRMWIHIVGTALASGALYLFLNSSYYARFVLTLNFGGINY
ncbi:hypothetical protein HOD08_01655 [bacterium]|nr:hypothetical protein [bacterium]